MAEQLAAVIEPTDSHGNGICVRDREDHDLAVRIPQITRAGGGGSAARVCRVIRPRRPIKIVDDSQVTVITVGQGKELVFVVVINVVPRMRTMTLLAQG